MTAPVQDAPAVFAVDQAGVISLEIADHDGRVRGYVVRPDDAAEGWGVCLHEVGADAVYHVGKPPGRLWSCDCPDARYRAKREARACKHTVVVRALKAMLNHLRPQETLAMSKTPDEPKAVIPAGGRGAMTAEQIDLVKRMICKDATDDELKLFLHYCSRTGLDPLAKQIYAVRRREGGQQKLVIITGIDGYRLIADRTGVYAGNDDAVYDDEAAPQKATVTVYKMVGGVRCPFTASARWKQYCPGAGQDFMWRKMPHLMLGKVAEALALRKAFPAELSGVYAEEEMHQAQEPAAAVEATATVVVNGRHVAGPAPSAPAPASPRKPFHEGLQDYDAKLCAEGLCAEGALVKHVAAKGRAAAFSPDMSAWTEDHVKFARAWAREFEAACREKSLKQTA